MPSPATLAKFVMTFMITPLNQEAINTSSYEGSKMIAPFNQEVIGAAHFSESKNSALSQEGAHTTRNSGIYMCEHGGFLGFCRYFSNPFGQCSKFFLCLRYVLIPRVIFNGH